MILNPVGLNYPRPCILGMRRAGLHVNHILIKMFMFCSGFSHCLCNETLRNTMYLDSEPYTMGMLKKRVK